MNTTTQQDTQAAANKAAEEGELLALKLIQKLNGIAMSLAADLVQGSGYQFQGLDYLDRNYVCERVVQWRAEWDAISPEIKALSEKLRAADRASRQVANKAEVEPVAFMYQDDHDLAEPGTGSCVVSKARCNFYRNETPLYATPPATTGPSTVLTDERASAIVEQARLAVDAHCDSLSMEPSKEYSDACLYHAIAREVAAQAGQVAVPGWISVKDSLPESPSQKVIVWIEMFYAPHYMHVGTCKNGNWNFDDSRLGQVTHWMPLPAAPSPKKESK